MGDCVLTFVPVNRIADPDYTGVDLEVAPAPERVRASWRVFGIQRPPLVLRQPLHETREPRRVSPQGRDRFTAAPS